MPNACTPNNIVGKLTGMMESSGIEIEAGTVEILDTSGQAQYHRVANRAGNDLDNAAGTEDSKKVKKFWQHLDDKILGSGLQLAGRILTDQRNPSGILGKDVTQPVIDFTTEHYKTVFRKATDEASIKAAQRQYQAGIKEVFDGIDTSKLRESQKGFFQEYRRYYERDGGDLYSGGTTTGIGEAVNNLGGNLIRNNLNVVVGNPLEVAIKLPALYDVHVFPGLAQFISKTKGNIWKRLPELEEAGVYGFEHAVEDTSGNLWQKLNKRWDGLITLTDVPTKNLVYLTGAANGGEKEGLKAVQDTLFSMRLGDTPRQRWGKAGKGETRLVGYTINTIKLHASMFESLLNPASTAGQRAAALRSIGVMYGMTGVIGGPAALIPKPLEDALVKVNPDLKETLDEHKTPFANLVQIGNVGQVGVLYDATKRSVQKAGTLWNSGVKAARNGDWNGFYLDAGFAVAKYFMFTKSFLGDSQIQKAADLGRDIARDDLESDLWTEARERFLPFTKSR